MIGNIDSSNLVLLFCFVYHNNDGFTNKITLTVTGYLEMCCSELKQAIALKYPPDPNESLQMTFLD